MTHLCAVFGVCSFQSKDGYQIIETSRLTIQSRRLGLVAACTDLCWVCRGWKQLPQWTSWGRFGESQQPTFGQSPTRRLHGNSCALCACSPYQERAPKLVNTSQSRLGLCETPSQSIATTRTSQSLTPSFRDNWTQHQRLSHAQTKRVRSWHWKIYFLN